jgi:Recombination endonuclease VII
MRTRLPYSKIRERYWARQGILEPDGSGPLTWDTYQAVKQFQRNRCAVCDKLFFEDDKGSDTADHSHETRLFRGVLCGKRRGCNWRFVGKVERFKSLVIKKGTGEEAAKQYLASPPAAQWLASKEN